MTAERLLEVVGLLAPLIEAERSRLDTDRELSPALVDALIEAGLFRLWLPRRLGGAELDPVSGLRVTTLEGSVGWTVMVSAAYGLFAGRLPARAARRIFGDRRAAVAGQLAPRGRADLLRGGRYRASGRWRFASGSTHATWFIAQCVMYRNGRTRPRIAGRPEMRLLFVPAAQCRVHDTWHVGGLRGTGSHDYSLKNVEVPVEHSIDILDDRPTRPEALYRFPAVPFVEAAVGAVPIGIARGALHAFRELTEDRHGSPARRLREHPAVQRDVGEAELHLHSAELVLFEAVEAMWQTTKRRERPSLEQRARLRMGCVNAGVSAARAVDIVYNLGGTASIFERNRLERCFRDVHTATQHGALAPKTLEVVGRLSLGLPWREMS